MYSQKRLSNKCRQPLVVFFVELYYFTRDADVLRGPSKSVDVAGCSPRPRSSRQTCLFLYGSLDLLDSLISLKF